MKKKFSFPNYLAKFSLQKQLALIFISLMILIIAVLLPVIDSNLNKIIDQEMYTVLNNSQYNFKNYNFSLESKVQEKQIHHMYYDESDGKVYPSTIVSQSEALGMVDVFRDGLLKMIKEKKTDCQAKGEYRGKTMYYQIQQTDDGFYLISLMYSDYSNELMSSLKEQIIYIFYIALAIIGIIIFIWVASLIKPLKLIRNYIDDIKEEKNSVLTIDRNDEVGIVSRSLVDMKEQLDIQNKIKEEMIHNISHDLKTPIALIKTYGQSIKDDIYPYGDKDSSMDVIIENAERLDSKVRSLLYLNRLDYMKDNVKTDKISMKVVIEHLTDQLISMHPTIKVELNLEDSYFIGEEEHWRICIENIMDNAYRYVNSTIIITLKENYLEIYNDGEAIDEENLEQLFKPYQKGTKGQFGLGLAIVNKTVTLYGYTVTAANKEKGVSFIIRKK